jgi:hypothetical protein
LKKIRKKKIGHVAIQNYFKSENISSFSPIKKPLLKPSHKIARVEAAKEWIKLDEKELESIIFSEESKFNLFYADGNLKV